MVIWKWPQKWVQKGSFFKISQNPFFQFFRLWYLKIGHKMPLLLPYDTFKSAEPFLRKLKKTRFLVILAKIDIFLILKWPLNFSPAEILHFFGSTHDLGEYYLRKWYPRVYITNPLGGVRGQLGWCTEKKTKVTQFTKWPHVTTPGDLEVQNFACV